MIPHPIAAAGALVTLGFGAALSLANATLDQLTVSKVVVFAGGIAISLIAIAAFLKATGRGLSWTFRAADGMEQLMGDPKANPPIPSLPEQVADIKDDVSELRSDVAELKEGQAKLLRLVEELSGDSRHMPPPPREHR